MSKNRKKKEHIKKLGIFVDYANLLDSSRRIGKNLDFRKLIEFLEKDFNSISEFKCIYFAYPEEWTRHEWYNYKGVHNFSVFLQKELWFHVKKKPLKIIEQRDRNGKILQDENWENMTVEKWNLDIELTMDVMQTWHHFDSMILFSGDSDFSCLAEFLIWKWKKVYVFSTLWNISTELKTHSSKYYDIKDLPDEVFR